MWGKGISMKKFAPSLAIASILTTSLLTFAPASYAVDATATPTPTARPRVELREDIKKSREEFKEKVKTEKEELKTEVKEARETFRSERAKVHADRLEKRFAEYNTRLTNIAARIQKNIDAKKAAGKDVSSAQTKLDAAKATLAQAVTDGATAVSMFRAITVSTWNVQLPEVKAAIEAANKARLEFVNARKGMIDAVIILKAIK